MFDIFQRTVLDGIGREIYSQYSEQEWGDSVNLWGLTSSMETTWGKVSTGDWILFYTGSDQYEYAAKVSDKEQNPDLGDVIRNNILGVDDDESRDWDLLLVLEDPVPVAISGHEVSELLDYGNNFPVRFIRVTQSRKEALQEEYISVDEFIQKIRTDDAESVA
ncbi:hypothetical protein [Halopenitus persicus]|uniref:hypothetical protein n=1 Tax=Halopenitus persicus TaxID=1048396 RepID=UPI0012FE7165|nr:hypothetical protein [Halopenitus persicus]